MHPKEAALHNYMSPLQKYAMPVQSTSIDDKSDQTRRRINDFAKRAFRDMADRDYIAARLAFRAGLMPQGLWAAQQAFEKYLKYILLVNRIPAKKVKHDIAAAFGLLDDLPFKIELSERGRKFFDHVAAYGPERYLSTSYFVKGFVLLDLDCVVWDLRRYCQVLNVFDGELPPDDQQMLDQAHEALKNIDQHSPHKFRLGAGLLEKILTKKDHPARSALMWRNPFYCTKARKTVIAQDEWYAENAPLYLYPEMLDEVEKYVYLSKPLIKAYRAHLVKVTADPSQRP